MGSPRVGSNPTGVVMDSCVADMNESGGGAAGENPGALAASGTAAAVGISTGHRGPEYQAAAFRRPELQHTKPRERELRLHAPTGREEKLTACPPGQ